MKKTVLIAISTVFVINSFSQNLNNIKKFNKSTIRNYENSLLLKTINKNKKDNASETLLGLSDSIMQTMYDTATLVVNGYFGNNQWFDFAWAEKFYVSQKAKLSSTYALLYCHKVINLDSTACMFIMDRNLNILGISNPIKYKDLKWNNNKYPNNGTGWTRFDFPNIIEVTDTFYVGFMLTQYSSLSDSIYLWSTKNGVQKTKYPQQNIYFTVSNGQVYYSDISIDWGVKLNLAVGAKLDFCYLTVDAGNDVTINLGDSAILNSSYSGTTSQDITIAWSDSMPDNNYWFANGLVVYPSKTSKYYLNVLSDGINGCFAYDSVTVHVNCKIELGNNITVNQSGQSVNITAPYLSSLSYNWSTGDTTNTITVSPTQSTTYTLTVSNNWCTATDEISVIITDVDKINIENNDISILHNNYQNNIIINFNNDYKYANISVFDYIGRNIYNENINSIKNKYNKTINISNFNEKGVYIINIQTDKGTFNEKIIIK